MKNVYITTNKLEIDKINFYAIDGEYDIFQLDQMNKNIPYTILDSDRTENAYLSSIVAITAIKIQNNGEKINRIYVLAKRNTLTVILLRKALENYADNIANIKKIESNQIPAYCLLQLFFNQIVHVDSLSGSGLLGKLYLFKGSRNKGTEVDLLEVNVSSKLALQVAVRRFTQIKILDEKRLAKFKTDPRYRIDIREKLIKQVSVDRRDKESPSLFVKHPLYRNQKPEGLKQFNDSKNNKLKAFNNTTSGILYNLLETFNKLYVDYFSNLSFSVSNDWTKLELGYNQNRSSKILKNDIITFFKSRVIYLVNQTGEDLNEITTVKNALNHLGLTAKIVETLEDQDRLYLSIIHDKSYYERKGIKDDTHPRYQKAQVQHITVENWKSTDSIDAFVYNTLKELIIKHDLRKNSLSLYKTKNNVFRYLYFVRIKDITYKFELKDNNKFKISEVPSGKDPFNLFSKLENNRTIECVVLNKKVMQYYAIKFSGFQTLLNENYKQYLIEAESHKKCPSLSKEQLLKQIDEVAEDGKSSKIVLLKKEFTKKDKFTPDEIYKLLQKYFDKKTNFYKEFLKGLNEQYGLAVNRGFRGDDMRNKYLPGMCDVNFKEIDNKVYYSTGVIGKGMNTSIPVGIRIREIFPLNEFNQDEIFDTNKIFELMGMLNVTFVRYSQLTVLPFPIKYMKEYYYLN